MIADERTADNGVACLSNVLPNNSAIITVE